MWSADEDDLLPHLFGPHVVARFRTASRRRKVGGSPAQMAASGGGQDYEQTRMCHAMRLILPGHSDHIVGKACAADWT
eukprot:2686597-Prymnesium_polylepis.1